MIRDWKFGKDIGHINMCESKKLVDMGIPEIKRFITNRYPFLLIDKVWEVVPGVSARGYKNVTVNEGFFQGHFPNSPLMPGMIQMESLFQMLSLTALTIEGNEGKSVRGSYANKVRLKERVLPGSRLDIEAELTEWDGVKGKGFAKGIVNDKEACSAEFEFSLT